MTITLEKPAASRAATFNQKFSSLFLLSPLPYLSTSSRLVLEHYTPTQEPTDHKDYSKPSLTRQSYRRLTFTAGRKGKAKIGSHVRDNSVETILRVKYIGSTNFTQSTSVHE
ncbi:hypothetical protein RRG08_057853 [Elysia crispata]|uniref:Uncharacterized protein n=1 Tax=Elysia crispata TaxID=231223 RepID=A0AAE1E7P9_9GAST|nr:hypothetical protein RRG08_057853 [Elysia crispata]